MCNVYPENEMKMVGKVTTTTCSNRASMKRGAYLADLHIGRPKFGPGPTMAMRRCLNGGRGRQVPITLRD